MKKKKFQNFVWGSAIRKMGRLFCVLPQMPKTFQKISHPKKTSHAWRKNTFATENFNQSMMSVPTPSLVLRIPTQTNLHIMILNRISTVSKNHEIRGIPTPTPTRLPTALVGGTHPGFWVYIMSCHVSLRINPSSSRALKVPSSFDAKTWMK